MRIQLYISEKVKSVDINNKLVTTLLHLLESTIEAKVGELGGYIESSDVYNGSNSNKNHSSSNRRASFVIRIPADNLGGFVDSLSDAYNITVTAGKSVIKSESVHHDSESFLIFPGKL